MHLTTSTLVCWTLACLPLLACAGDDGVASSTGETTATGTTGGATAGTLGSTTSTSSSTATTTSSTGAESTTDATESATATATETETETETGSDTDEPGLECDALVDGPLRPVEVSSAFDGSEDIAFDGAGRLTAKRGDELLSIDSEGGEVVLASGIPQAYGLRYRDNGDLLVALPGEGRVIAVAPGGDVTDLLTGLQTPNGVYVDLLDRVWITDFGASMVLLLDVDETVTPIVTGADAEAANGVVYDPDRDTVFYTNYQAGLIRGVSLEGGVPSEPTVLASIPGKPDGLALDGCGNLYIVDQGQSRLYRLALDPEGAAIGEATLLASLPTNVANAQFGSGTGFDPLSLYLGGNPGVIYRVEVMLPGAAIPTVP